MNGLMFLLGNISLRTRLMSAFIILITIPTGIIGFRYYTSSRDILIDLATKNAYEVVKRNNEILDSKLTRIKDNCWAFLIDKDLFKILSENKPDSTFSIGYIDREVSKVLNKYFSQIDDIYSIQLVNNTNILGTAGNNTNFIPEGIEGTEIYQKAVEAKGGISWVPTYDFGKMYNLINLKNINLDYRYLFSAVELVQPITVINGDTISYNLPKDFQKPILIINFKEDFYQKLFKKNVPVEGSYFFVTTSEGQIVSHEDNIMLAQRKDYPWLMAVAKKGSGTDIVEIDGKQMVICYDTSKVTGWIAIMALPPQVLLDQILPVIRSNTIYATIILTLIALILSYLISAQITRPIMKLSKAIKRSGEGDFETRLREEGSMEIKGLIHKFNGMNERIRKLITENYEIKIREREAEITALNLQLDPHFMYNTLNLINLISIENNQDEISEMIMSLSSMLKYTVRNKSGIVSFEQDMDYMKSYILIMTKRLEGKFSVEYDIDPALYNFNVPKFLIQPFVENALIHGFERLRTGGRLKIRCFIKDNNRYYCVEDNGKGMEPELIKAIMDPGSKSVGISNVNKRIQLLYGEQYGVNIESSLKTGTKITIVLPL